MPVEWDTRVCVCQQFFLPAFQSESIHLTFKHFNYQNTLLKMKLSITLASIICYTDVTLP